MEHGKIQPAAGSGQTEDRWQIANCEFRIADCEKQGDRSQKSEIRGQRSENRGSIVIRYPGDLSI